jgi:thiosulfate/3-mercaptopyruvate sulfurtransferase
VTVVRHDPVRLPYRGIMPPVLSGPTVSTQWLADHLGSDDLVLLDATVLVVPLASGAPAWISGHDRYLLDGHLPGAVFADLLHAFSAGGGHPFTRPDERAFERAAASVGVRESSAVVAYDSAGGTWATRVWWLFRSYGFESVAVLEGGLSTWLTEGRDVDTGPASPEPGSILAVPQPAEWADHGEVERVLAAGTPLRARRRTQGSAVRSAAHTSAGSRQVKFSQR